MRMQKKEQIKTISVAAINADPNWPVFWTLKLWTNWPYLGLELPIYHFS